MNRMKEKRLAKGLRQKDIAKSTGLSKPAISLYENGKVNPSMESAFKIAAVLDSTVDELFKNRGEKKCLTSKLMN